MNEEKRLERTGVGEKDRFERQNQEAYDKEVSGERLIKKPMKRIDKN